MTARTALVIGAGVIGASVAQALARRGVAATVIDRAMPGSGASAATFGWINASFAETADYFCLRAAAVEEYARLSRDMGAALPLCPGGSLWWEEEGKAFDDHMAEMLAFGADVRAVGPAEFAQLAPAVATPPARALYTPAEAAIDGVALTQALLDRAVGAGANLLIGPTVRALTHEGGTVTGVDTDFGRFVADQVILATGAATPALLSPLGINLPVHTKPGLILHTRAVPPCLRPLILSPDIHVRQGAQGHLIAGEIFSGDGPGQHQITTAPQSLAHDLLLRIGRLLGRDDLRIDRVMLGARPVPGDGFPAIGACGPQGLFVAVMHSGVTLGPLVGRLLADEVDGGDLLPLLAAYRPTRFG